LGASAIAADYENANDDEEPRYEARSFGAIAYSPSNRAHGWSYDYSSRRQAERRALDRCGRYARDCQVAVSFRSCGALAVGVEGYGSGWGGSRRLADTYALRSCRKHSDGCMVIRSLCTTR
jgi:serine/threonine-protein kinase